MHNNEIVLSVKEQDTTPAVEYQLEGVDTVKNANSVRFYMQHQESGELVVNDTATIENESDAVVSYDLASSHTARVGRHLAEFVVHYSDGTQETSPPSGFIAIDVHESTNRNGTVDPADSNIDASVVSTDEIQANDTSTVNVTDTLQVDSDLGVRDLSVSDDGTTVTLDYNGSQIVIDSDGVQVPEGPSVADGVARKSDVDGKISNPLSETLNANGYGIRNLSDPGSADEAANKGYVDSVVDSGATVGHSGIVNAADEGYPGDMSGGDIADLINNNLGKKIIFPEGEYALRSEVTVAGTDSDLVHLVGEPQATFVVDDSAVDRSFTLGTSDDPIENVRIENMTLRSEGTSSSNATWGRIYATGDVYTENLHAVGKVDRSQYSHDRFSLLCNMMDETGVAIHKGISFRDGEVHDTSADNVGQTIGFGAEESHVGTNILIGARLEEWADNGFYVKDGTGANILIGCSAYNCGGANFRLGINDTAISCESVWNANPDNYVNGVLLDSDESDGTSVMSFRAIRETGGNDCVRFRSSSESLTFRDLYIRNETSQWSLSARGSGTGQAVIENATLIDNGGTSTRGAAVEADRDNLHLRDCTIRTSSTSWRAAVQVSSGSCRITGGKLEAAGPPYTVDIQSSDRVSLRDVKMDGGFNLSGQPNVLEVTGCDLRGVATSDVFSDTEPSGDFVWSNNLGHLDSVEFGERQVIIDSQRNSSPDMNNGNMWVNY